MLDENDCTFFMRSSTGRFCADLVPNYPEITFFSSDRNAEETCRRGLEPLAAPDIDAAVINSLTLNQYHQVCYWHNLSLYRSTSSFSSKLVNLGAVYSTSSDSDWTTERDRRKSSRMGGPDPGSIFSWVHSLEGHELCILWLSQANYIFKCLGISFNFEEYAVVHHTSFRLTLSPTIVDPPQGFLFLCPFEDFRTERPYSFKWPDCPAYWSFDPSGAEPLSAEDAVRFGFPSMQLSTEISGYSRYGEVYAGLREFYQGKGLDPDSQDVARYLGQPLYQLSDEVHGQFTHKSDTILEPLSTHHGSQQLSPTEELSFSNTFRFVRNLVANFVPGTQNVESDGLGFSPIFM
ncbi:hypothetical protein K438DRAFT_589322 [Mycena galopus ATCC 62051]|nr:hypothetical protein K438DRAFT_589322 [Mycena galopus ATCC 62051]